MQRERVETKRLGLAHRDPGGVAAILGGFAFGRKIGRMKVPVPPSDEVPHVARPDPKRRAPETAAERGRGATFNPDNRFRRESREAYDDGWTAPPADPDAGPWDDAPPKPRTTVTITRARTIIARNSSPDIPFNQSINPYQGCEHGCVYCYARPTHAYLDLSPGLEFETKLFAKPDAAALLRAEIGKPGYACDPIALAPTPIRISRSSGNGRSRGRCWRCSRCTNIRSP